MKYWLSVSVTPKRKKEQQKKKNKKGDCKEFYVRKRKKSIKLFEILVEINEISQFLM